MTAGIATIAATATKPPDECEAVPTLSLPGSSSWNCTSNSTSRTCEVTVTEQGDYTFTANLVNITDTCISTVTGKYFKQIKVVINLSIL